MPETNLKIPTHIAFIMDGNGRWAKKRLMPRSYGHRQGVKALKNVIRELMRLGVKYATFYAFSTENWNRPAEEVNGLMSLFEEQFDALSEYEEENVRLRFIGDRSRLPNSLQEKMERAEKASADRTGLTVVIAVNYGGKDELCRAAGKLCELSRGGFISECCVTEEMFDSLLDTGWLPDVDLLIRTGGELRISNFLLWKAAYAELYFCDTLWPDFGRRDLMSALKDFSARDRRFGRIEENINN